MLWDLMLQNVTLLRMSFVKEFFGNLSCDGVWKAANEAVAVTPRIICDNDKTPNEALARRNLRFPNIGTRKHRPLNNTGILHTGAVPRGGRDVLSMHMVAVVPQHIRGCLCKLTVTFGASLQELSWDVGFMTQLPWITSVNSPTCPSSVHQQVG